jgi:glycosyl transferase family 25
MTEKIVKVIYINLERRGDRRGRIEAELAQVFSPDQIVRLRATETPSWGAIGCAHSHMRALTMAMEGQYENCLIVEDDAKWDNISRGCVILRQLMSEPYDVILLGGVINYGHGAPDKDTYRVRDAQTATAYLVARHYYPTLLANFEAAYKVLSSTETNIDKAGHVIDQTWKQLQQKDKFYMVYPVMMYQRNDYSDIQKHHVNYESFFTRHHYTIGITVVCTNAYFVLGLRFVKKFMHHYKGTHDIKFYLFTDTDPRPYAPQYAHQIVYVPTTHANWQDGTNSKFSSFLQLEQENCDHLFYFDADTNITSDFTEEWFLGDMVGGEHYNNDYRKPDGTLCEKPYDRNPQSKAYIPHDTPLPQMYYYGAFFGGTKQRVLDFCTLLCQHQAADRLLPYEPAWNDESYINQHFHYHPPTKVVRSANFKFDISDKGGIGDPRNMRLNIQGYKDKLLQHPTLIFDFEHGGVLVFYEMTQHGIMWGPWINTEKAVEAVFVLSHGEKVYGIQEGIHTKLVSESGQAKYYTGPLTAFQEKDWSASALVSSYLDAGQNYKIKKITKSQKINC